MIKAAYFMASFNTSRLLSMMERWVTPFWISMDVVDCMEFNERMGRFLFAMFCKTVSAMRWSVPSMVISAGKFNSSALLERNMIVSKLASDSVEQPEKAAK